ncbi:hypothetical protein BT96DRAFT_942227 [Gymnopus androsaceus JB14]|uniref:Uncharacterized protein n=1 Tax=Gymnopus androsaceus JB14 TaxID=1447944 RepID=A0A6A4HD17_9AGAR|nr:hypothetical protein BT96DRAFT_942227 [Gymnopus androsaceus JB14]
MSLTSGFKELSKETFKAQWQHYLQEANSVQVGCEIHFFCSGKRLMLYIMTAKSTTIPSTSNAIESQHFNLHSAMGKDQDALAVVHKLYIYGKQCEQQYNALMGLEIWYPVFAGSTLTYHNEILALLPSGSTLESMLQHFQTRLAWTESGKPRNANLYWQTSRIL